MNFGYLLFVSDHDTIDYTKLAYALALSIKGTQKPGYDKVALVIDNPDRLHELNSSWVFDEVIEWSEQAGWDGRSWMDKLSPWEYTVCLDSDMLFLRDYSHWIDYFIENTELYVSNKSYTYRGHKVTNDYYRKTFTKNDLPNLYSFYTFFKKNSNLSQEFFELGRYIIKNPIEFSNKFLSKLKPKVIGTDEAFSLSAKILDIQDEIAYDLEFPKVLHMKGQIQDFPFPAELVSDHLGFYFDSNCNLKVGNYQQTDIIHYVEKDKITLEVLHLLEKKVWKI